MKTSSHFSSKNSALVLGTIFALSIVGAGITLAQGLNIPTNLSNAAITIQKIFLSPTGVSTDVGSTIILDGLLGNITTKSTAGLGGGNITASGNITLGGDLQFTHPDYRCPAGSTGCILKVDASGVVVMTNELSGSDDNVFRRTAGNDNNIFLSKTDGTAAEVGTAPNRQYLRVGVTNQVSGMEPERNDTAMVVAGNIESRGGLYIKKSNSLDRSNEGLNKNVLLDDNYSALNLDASTNGSINFKSKYDNGSPTPQSTSFRFTADGASTKVGINTVGTPQAELQVAGTGSLLVGTQPGCFLADTQVTLADGTTKSIQDIKLGDQLKAVDGVNTVKSLLRPILGDQPVYAINTTDAFFTANHPFLTTDGWKSLDPETTKKESPDLEVSMLQIGDVLITESGKVLVMSLTASSRPASTPLYNFSLDGDRTYFADGFAEHNKQDCVGVEADINTSTLIGSTTSCNGVAAIYADADASNATGAKGRVGIRTTDPKAVLDVNGDSLMRGSLSVDTRLKVGTNMTIGYPLNYNPSTDKLAINGNTRANAYYYNSDRRYKSDIVALSSSLENLLKLTGYSYFSNLEKKNTLGIIAQEVEAVYPDLVQTDPSGYKSVQYGNLVAPIIEAIRELATKIDSLFTLYVSQQAKIDTLEARLLKLESKIK